MRVVKRTRASWAVARDEALERDGYNCQGSEFGLQHICLGRIVVHHRKRRAQGGTDELDNLVTLCREAHDKTHANPGLAYELGLLKRSAS